MSSSTESHPNIERTVETMHYAHNALPVSFERIVAVMHASEGPNPIDLTQVLPDAIRADAEYMYWTGDMFAQPLRHAEMVTRDRYLRAIPEQWHTPEVLAAIEEVVAHKGEEE